MTDLRRRPRQKTLLRGEITTLTGMVMSCAIRDLSEGGARLTFGDATWVPDRFKLAIFGREWTANAEVRWRKDNQVGVEFRSLRIHQAPAERAQHIA
ncbi:PilZ domain-containing protein [Salinarimonas soli]|uniref:PilZ domain-containing protein n=1 Tax=Salinarimonas soli TaxID=1638099 RepID=A0A5B2VPQ8_9HYPH|nr:PilZ domain-containing protein [Salinarimonas soli]KAA2241101.1 PilZ domain-containing protein [Salinarimonas soli]